MAYLCTCLPGTHHAAPEGHSAAVELGVGFPLFVAEEGWAGSMIPSRWLADSVQLLKLSAVQGKTKEKTKRASSEFCQRAQ